MRSHSPLLAMRYRGVVAEEVAVVAARRNRASWDGARDPFHFTPSDVDGHRRRFRWADQNGLRECFSSYRSGS